MISHLQLHATRSQGGGYQMANSYTSSQQTITSSGTFTLAHGLASAPKFVSISLVCQTAEYGYSAGDVINLFPHGSPYLNAGASVKITSTDLLVQYASASCVFSAPYYATNGTGGTQTPLDNTSWKAVFYAQLGT